MIAAVDVDYRDGFAVAACIEFEDWTSERASRELVEVLSPIEPYQPGEFYRRELPCILKVLNALETLPRICVIDGFVWLGSREKPGLGAHLFEALGGKVAVVGVAKTQFRGAGPAVEILRGESRKPLWISAAGMDLHEAASAIARMGGGFRMPTLIKRADQLCRTFRVSG
jgi:deoxyribonuclease V